MTKISMAELFARDKAKRQAEAAAQAAWEQTPEGAEWRREQEAHHRRMAEADARYEAENPTSDEDEDEDDEPEEF